MLKLCKRGHFSERYKNGVCKQCMKFHNEVRYVKRRPKRLTKFDKTSYGKKYYEDHKEYFRLKSKERRENKKEEIKSRMKEWKLNNKQRHCELNKLSRERHLEKTRERSRIYQKNNPHTMKVSSHNRRAREKSALGRFTKKDVEFLLEKQKRKCANCFCRLSKMYHLDHVIPLKLNGTNFRSNLQLLCPPCNQTKWAHDPIVFAQKQGRLL